MFAGKEGWFPAAYAEELPDTATSVTSAAPDVVTSSSSAQLPMYSNISDDMAAGQAESQTNANENKFATDFSAFGCEISLPISSFLDHFLQYFSCIILLELVLVG